MKIAYNKSYFFCAITDNGKGISGQEVLDPFVTSRTTRRVGLGLPLLKKAVEDTGGYLNIRRIDEKGGTELKFKMFMSHIDAKPTGDLPRFFSDLFYAWPEISFQLFILKEEEDNGVLSLDYQVLRDEIDNGTMDYIGIRKYIYSVIQEELNL